MHEVAGKARRLGGDRRSRRSRWRPIPFCKTNSLPLPYIQTQPTGAYIGRGRGLGKDGEAKAGPRERGAVVGVDSEVRKDDASTTALGCRNPCLGKEGTPMPHSSSTHPPPGPGPHSSACTLPLLLQFASSLCPACHIHTHIPPLIPSSLPPRK